MAPLTLVDGGEGAVVADGTDQCILQALKYVVCSRFLPLHAALNIPLPFSVQGEQVISSITL